MTSPPVPLHLDLLSEVSASSPVTAWVEAMVARVRASEAPPPGFAFGLGSTLLGRLEEECVPVELARRLGLTFHTDSRWSPDVMAVVSPTTFYHVHVPPADLPPGEEVVYQLARQLPYSREVETAVWCAAGTGALSPAEREVYMTFLWDGMSTAAALLAASRVLVPGASS